MNNKEIFMPGLPLSEMINTGSVLDKKLIHKWNTATLDLATNGVLNDTQLDPNDCNRYKYDFYGLLAFIGVEEKYHYPHLLVNGYTSPTEYDGVRYSITLLNNTHLERYYNAFTR